MRRDDFSFYLVDASGFIFRAFHALPPLTNPQGQPVGALYGFLSMLIMLLRDHKPDKLGIVFDVARETFRQTLYPAYKAHRPPPPPELVSQFSLVREACTAFGLRVLEQPGYEADDLIASYVKQAQENQVGVTIVSSDKDLMQLISPTTRMWDPMKSKVIQEPEVKEKFGVRPDQVIDVQALTGDASDNIPGVPGIGIKTAQNLIREFGSLDHLYANLDQVPQPKRHETLKTHQKEAFLSRELVLLAYNTPISVPAEALTFQEIDIQQSLTFLKNHGFTSLINRLPSLEQNASQTHPQALSPVVPSHASQPSLATYTLIQDESTLIDWIQRATEQGWIAVDLETTSLNALEAEVVGIALALRPGEAAYVPVGHHTDTPQISLTRALHLLRPLFENASVLKIGHHLKYDGLVLKKYDALFTPIADTLLMSYLLNGGKHPHNLDFLSQHYLQHTTITYPEVTRGLKGASSFRDVPLESACAYAAEDADMTLRLWHLFRPQIQDLHLNRLYERVERPLVDVLIDLEHAGIRVDAEALALLSQGMEKRLSTLAQTVYTLAGETFNIASPKQLGVVLFEHLGLHGGKKTKTGAYGTASDVLEKLAAQGQTIAQDVLDWRGTAKLKNTYADALPQQINPETGRVHTSFLMAGTSTGRLASTDPNLQNIPVRTEEGRAIRKAFVPEPGCILASFDYSQIELRLLAHMGHVIPLIDAFQRGVDIHQETASQVFGVPLDQVDRTLRRQAKTINFGIIYGISAYGLSERLGISPQDAARYIEAYLAHYAGIETYMKRTKAIALEHGYVETLWGRRCYLQGIQDRNSMIRQAAERQAINAPLQGTAADLIKRAMVDVHALLTARKTPVRMILQIHDELLFEGPEEEIRNLAPHIQQCMTQVATLEIPLVVDVGIGSNWDEAH